MIHLTNQKLDQKNGLVHHEATNIDRKELCLVKVLAFRVCHILENGGNDTSLIMKTGQKGNGDM